MHMQKKLIVSLCAVTLISLAGAAVGPSLSANADNTVSTTVSQPEEFKGTVDLIDVNGKVLGQTSVLSGKIGDHETVTLPTGYVAVSNGASTIDYVLNKEKTPIKIRKIGDVDVTRTIRLHQPDGTVKTVTQVTKAGKNFDQYVVPKIKYYNPSVTIVPSETAKAGKDMVVNVSYTKTYPDWTIGVRGYEVVASGPITRTINFVDENGKKIAPSKIETVNREILVKKGNIGHIYRDRKGKVIKPSETVSESNLSTVAGQKGLSAEAVKSNKKNKVLGYLVLEVNGRRSNVIDPAYKLQDVKAPTVKGYQLKDKKFANIDGQYLWLSTPETLTNSTKLANGLDEFLTKDTTINVVYIKDGAAAAQGQNSNNSNGQGTNVQNGQNSSNGSAQNNNDGSNLGDTSANNGGGSNGGSSAEDSNTGALPQTGNKPMNWLVMGFTSALSALGLGFLGSRKRRD